MTSRPRRRQVTGRSCRSCCCARCRHRDLRPRLPCACCACTVTVPESRPPSPGVTTRVARKNESQTRARRRRSMLKTQNAERRSGAGRGGAASWRVERGERVSQNQTSGWAHRRAGQGQGRPGAMALVAGCSRAPSVAGLTGSLETSVTTLVGGRQHCQGLEPPSRLPSPLPSPTPTPSPQFVRTSSRENEQTLAGASREPAVGSFAARKQKRQRRCKEKREHRGAEKRFRGSIPHALLPPSSISHSPAPF